MTASNNMFGPDKILGPEHAEHARGVVIRAINRHAKLGSVVRDRIADAVAQALSGKEMRPSPVKHASIKRGSPASKSPAQLDHEIAQVVFPYRRGR